MFNAVIESTEFNPDFSFEADVVEFILAGASLVQVGTMNYQNPNLGAKLKEKLSQYFSQNGTDTIEDLIGKVDCHSG